MKKKINNSVKRYHDTVVYSITSNVANRRTFFKQMIWCNMWIEVLRVTKLKYEFMLYAFCLNYDHFHILIFPDNAIGNCSQILQFLKRNTSRNINKILGYDKINLCNADDISQSHRKTNLHKTVDDFSQSRIKNPGNMNCTIQGEPITDAYQSHDNELKTAIRHLNQYVYAQRQKFIVHYGKNRTIPKFKWQKSFHDHIIRIEKDFENHWNYINYNYLKHGLPEDWKFTGLKYRELIDE